MRWLITRDRKSITAKCGDITLDRDSPTKLWASLMLYYFKWIREGKGEFSLEVKDV